MRIKTIQTSKKNFIIDVGMEKQEKQELRWRVSVLPIPAFHVVLHVLSTRSGMQEWVIDTLYPNSCFSVFPSLHLKYFRINFCY